MGGGAGEPDAGETGNVPKDKEWRHDGQDMHEDEIA